MAKTEIQFNISNLEETTYTFKLSNHNGEELLFGYDNIKKEFFINRKNSGNTSFSEKFANKITSVGRTSTHDNLSGTILLDKTSIELFYDNGETVMTEIFFPNTPYTKLSIEGKNQEFILDNIEVHELNFN